MSADKPDPGENEQISLKVAGQDGNEVVFKVKKTTIFKKIFEAYAQKMGRASNVFKFSFEGTRLEPDQTPANAGLENDDIIDVMAEQTGGH
ncbi:hypothetical protein MP638_006733 [Amoeboaphelidium occidentale]|nr:hypothetical protein MP638_006733 [Amoeboaphelidium occidentale]